MLIALLNTSASGSKAGSERKATSASSFDRRSITSVNPAAATASTRSAGMPFATCRFMYRPAMNSITLRFTSSAGNPSFPERVASDRSTSSPSRMRSPRASRMERMPRVWRRRPYGSAVPVGTSPTPKQPHTMSILSAIATAAPMSVDGRSSDCPFGR